eukprot:CAMPEP_0202869184 /NCGR_PEP_ID=MMETSP1391-20130828/12100_1 /ASSEMBLY_ACC=CAM_ASM_000867 /TAXON_ID=1034604 /ORGANISM="Chlamydomonas leiostraca, Strain SAG 11-49" /LENGTH=287 /DNA_ID=CAMNT_0049549461 /DNA_START=76 /DNA_END=939 /DNA_ORIENTATION=-
MSDDEAKEVQEKLEDLNVDDELSLDFGKKKKKKSKPAAPAADDVNVFEGDDAGAAPAEGAAPAPAAEGEDLDLDLDFAKKKKKKKKVRKEEEFGDDGEAGEEGGAGEDEGVAKAKAGAAGSFPWSGSDRDYTYEELLDRVFGILREKNPELTGERRRTVLKPPQVAREGTKKTVFTNFMDLCKAMNRQPEHVSMYLLAELGTSGSLDGQQRLIVKGRFLPKSFETVLRRYVNEYVLCPGCKSVDTLLDKDSATRLMHLRCQQCSASRTVSAIKSGFVARVTRRTQGA